MLKWWRTDDDDDSKKIDPKKIANCVSALSRVPVNALVVDASVPDKVRDAIVLPRVLTSLEHNQVLFDRQKPPRVRKDEFRKMNDALGSIPTALTVWIKAIDAPPSERREKSGKVLDFTVSTPANHLQPFVLMYADSE